jgi:hypothetical protein
MCNYRRHIVEDPMSTHKDILARFDQPDAAAAIRKVLQTPVGRRMVLQLGGATAPWARWSAGSALAPPRAPAAACTPYWGAHGPGRAATCISRSGKWPPRRGNCASRSGAKRIPCK